ncbi:MAG: hypothetical protein AB9907_07710 [Flexilinea sp.]
MTNTDMAQTGQQAEQTAYQESLLGGFNKSLMDCRVSFLPD